MEWFCDILFFVGPGLVMLGLVVWRRITDTDVSLTRCEKLSHKEGFSEWGLYAHAVEKAKLPEPPETIVNSVSKKV